MNRVVRRCAGAMATMVGAGALAGCISIGPGDPTPHAWYELSAPLPAEVATRTDSRGLRVDVLPGSTFYEAIAIAFSRAPGERAYYQFASWTEPVAQRLARITTRDLRERKLFADVDMVGRGSPAGLYLRLVVQDFYHDAAVEPGVARVAFSAELVDPATRRNLGRWDFSQAVPVGQADAAGAVAAFDVAVARALDELAAWL